MYMEINDQTTLHHIRKHFSDYYPYLQMEFYNKPHKKYEKSDPSDLVYPGKSIIEIRKTHLSGLLEIQPWYKVSDVEREFQQRFGLSVQVFWKNKDNWEQSRGLDDFTLKELNEMARNSSDEFILSEPDSEYRDFE